MYTGMWGWGPCRFAWAIKLTPQYHYHGILHTIFTSPIYYRLVLARILLSRIIVLGDSQVIVVGDSSPVIVVPFKAIVKSNSRSNTYVYSRNMTTSTVIQK